LAELLCREFVDVPSADLIVVIRRPRGLGASGHHRLDVAFPVSGDGATLRLRPRSVEHGRDDCGGSESESESGTAQGRPAVERSVGGRADDDSVNASGRVAGERDRDDESFDLDREEQWVDLVGRMQAESFANLAYR
jgi:hypothetical protein